MENIKKTLEKFKNNKLIWLILIIGIVFLFIPAEKEEKVSYEGSYEKELLEKTESILEEISGAGRVSVMMSFYDKGTKVPLTEPHNYVQSVKFFQKSPKQLI